MLAILQVSNVHIFHIFQPIFMILISKFIIHRALSDKTYLLLGLLSPLKFGAHRDPLSLIPRQENNEI